MKNKKRKQGGTGRNELAPGVQVASSGEMTGMVPTPPQNEQQAESYGQLGNVPKSKAGKKKG